MESTEQDLRGHRGSITHGPDGADSRDSFCSPLSRIGRTKGLKSGRKPKRRKRGNGCPVANFRSSFWRAIVLALRAVEKFRMKGECEGAREGEWF